MITGKRIDQSLYRQPLHVDWTCKEGEKVWECCALPTINDSWLVSMKSTHRVSVCVCTPFPWLAAFRKQRSWAWEGSVCMDTSSTCSHHADDPVNTQRHGLGPVYSCPLYLPPCSVNEQKGCVWKGIHLWYLFAFAAFWFSVIIMWVCKLADHSSFREEQRALKNPSPSVPQDYICTEIIKFCSKVTLEMDALNKPGHSGWE